MTTKTDTQELPASVARRIVFFHPDLGIGGAERLIIDAAVGLQELGHKVTIFTSHCDPQHCFEEARDGMLDVRVRGNSIFPSSIFNRFHILLAILRQIHLVLAIAFFGDELHSIKPDIFIVDQLSACVPLLRWLYPRKRTLFYCHFPDQLLVDRKEAGLQGIVKNVYRLPFDWFEGWSMSASDRIVVNSNFTKSVATRVFPTLANSYGVIYPCVTEPEKPTTSNKDSVEKLWKGKYKIFLSINRFERKKHIGLAIKAYKGLSSDERQGTRLILAGGYDHRVAENVQYHQELVELAEGLGLRTATAKTVPTALGVPSNIEVLFMLSVPDSFKTTLFRNATLLLYTPPNEHFGIVPVEAMKYGLPVLASNTGGPLETIIENETGWLRDVSKTEDWTAVMRKFLRDSDKDQLIKMRKAGPKRVQQHFTRDTMAEKFDDEINAMVNTKRSVFLEGSDVLKLAGFMGIFIAGIIMAIVKQRNKWGSDRRVSEFARARRMKQSAQPQKDMEFYSVKIL